MGSSNGNNRTSRLVVIESDKNARDYIKRSLAASGLPVRIVGEASEIADGMRLARGLQPDMILLELPVNATETLDMVKQLRDERPHTAVIISTHAPSPAADSELHARGRWGVRGASNRRTRSRTGG